jgi:sugar O-acyltransferase (sialic acid O-acetyltransferase NeuD family)
VERLVIIGAGGFAREVLDVVEAINRERPTWDVVGFVDDGDPDEDLLEARGHQLLGGSDHLERLDAAFVIGIGDPATRRRLDERASSAGLLPATVVHPQATMASLVDLGPGSVVTAGVRMTTNISTGRHVHLNLNTTVGHDCVLGDYVTVNPGVNISGSCVIGDGVMLGTGAAVIQGLTIGAGATVGAGAVAVKDVPPGVTAVGIPARPIG